MSDVFTDNYKIEQEKLVVEGLGEVVISRPSIKEYKALLAKYMPTGSDDLSMEDGLSMQFELVSKCLVEPKKTVEELESLPKEAMPVITKIFQAIQNSGEYSGN